MDDGLGNGRWLISPGVTVGLMAAERIQFFPIASYQYASTVVGENSFAGDEATHGLTFQVITPLVFSEKFFMQVTPILQLNNINDERTSRYVQELFGAYAIKPDLQITGYYNGNFEDEIHQVSFGLSVYL